MSNENKGDVRRRALQAVALADEALRYGYSRAAGGDVPAVAVARLAAAIFPDVVDPQAEATRRDRARTLEEERAAVLPSCPLLAYAKGRSTP